MDDILTWIGEIENFITEENASQLIKRDELIKKLMNENSNYESEFKKLKEGMSFLLH